MNPGMVDVARRAPATRFLLSCVLALSLLLLGITHPSPASAQAIISEISGTVVNGTAGSSVPPNLNVTLLTIDQDKAQFVDQETQVVGADGSFRFTDILQAPNYFYRVVADNGDHTPYVDVLQGDPTTDLEITIWDSTSSLDDIVVESYSFLVPAQSLLGRTRQIGVLTVVTLRNDGDHVWIPDVSGTDAGQMPELLRFSLPEGYDGLSPENTLQTPSDVLQVPTGFAIVGAIPPGSHDFIFTYAVDYNGGEFDFPINMYYGAERLRVMIPDVGAHIVGEGLGEEQVVAFDDANYRVVEGTGYERGAQVNLQLTNLPQPTTIQNFVDFFQGKTYILVIVWVAGAAMLAVLIYSLISSKRRLAAEAAGSQGEIVEGPARTRDAIVADIASLDDRHEAGEVDDEEYNRRRDELKAEALRQPPESTQEQ